jgi:pseudaminic acid synthase
MTKDIRTVEKAIGTVSYELTEKMKSGRTFSRSLYVAEDMKAGDTITEKNARSVRPGYGLHPKYLKDIVGREVNSTVQKGTPLSFDYILHD